MKRQHFRIFEDKFISKLEEKVDSYLQENYKIISANMIFVDDMADNWKYVLTVVFEEN